MGLIKDIFKKNTGNGTRIEAVLKMMGFEYEEYVYGSAPGYQKRIQFYSRGIVYCTYVHCDLEHRTLRIYKEYNVGGYVASMDTGIPESLIENDNPDVFIDWLDRETKDFLI